MPFSILERIDVGETPMEEPASSATMTFSILERIDVGETMSFPCWSAISGRAFSILERIDVGETIVMLCSVRPAYNFQYPRTDRRG